MNQRNKKIIIGGLSIAILTSSLLAFLRYSRKSLDQKIKSSLQKCIIAIQKQSQSKKTQSLKDNSQIVQMLLNSLSGYVDINQLKDQYVSDIQVNKVNWQSILVNVKLCVKYLENKQSLNQCIYENQKITKDIELPNKKDFNHSQREVVFLKFIVFEFLSLITQMEEILIIDQGKEDKLIDINLYFKSVIDMCSSILNKYPEFKIFFAEALFMKIDWINSINKLYHKCTDYEYANKLSINQPNPQCSCSIVNLLLRYISIITPTYQLQFGYFLIEYEILCTKDYLTKIGLFLLYNGYYLTHQLLDDNLFQISPLNNLLILPCSLQSVRYEIMSLFPDNITWYLYCQKLILLRNHPKTWQIFLPHFIDSHVILYSFISDKQTLELLLKNQIAEDTLNHFFLMILILETKDTTEISNTQDEQTIIDWFSKNLELLLASEVIIFLQLQYIQTIIRSYQEISIPIFANFYLKCLRQSCYENSQKGLTNQYLFRLMGFLIMILQRDLPTQQTIEKVVSIFPCKDDEEKSNIFNSIFTLLLLWPSTNEMFMEQVRIRCSQYSEEASLSFLRYQTQILYSQTLVIDNLKISLQTSLFFANLDLIFQKFIGIFECCFQNFEIEYIYIQRLVILIVDILENPYYCLNILMQNQSELPKLKNLEISLIKRAAIGLMDVNKEMYLQEFYEVLSRFLHIKEVPSYIMDLLVLNRNGKYSLKHSHSQTTCFMYLQKDVRSLNNYLSQINSYYDELLHPIESFPFLKDLRNILYQNESFINLIQLLIRTQQRMKIDIWISKFLYYGKEILLSNPSNKLLQTLFKEPQVMSFIDELKRGNPQSLVKYLKQ